MTPGGWVYQGFSARRQDVEGDLDVVVGGRVAGGQFRVLAVGVAADAGGPGQRLGACRCLRAADGRGLGLFEPDDAAGLGVEIVVVVAGGEADRARIGRAVGDLGGEVEVLVVIGQIARGEARADRRDRSS